MCSATLSSKSNILEATAVSRNHPQIDMNYSNTEKIFAEHAS